MKAMKTDYTNPKIYITNSGVGVIDMPIKPTCHGKGFCCDGRRCDSLTYTEEILPKAKEGVVYFKDQKLIKAVIAENLKNTEWDYVNDRPKADICTLPKGYRVGFEIISDRKTGNEETFRTFEVALLLPIEQEKIYPKQPCDNAVCCCQYNSEKAGFDCSAQHLINPSSRVEEVKSAEEIFKECSDEAMGEICPKEDWDKLLIDNSDEGKLFRAVIKAMEIYASQWRKS